MASYLGNSPETILQVRKRNFRYVATSNQTVFSGNDSNSLSLSVNTADVEVFLNGVLLDQTDYTITATQLTLSAGAATDDIIEVITNTTFASADQYSKEEVDNKVSVAITNVIGTAGAALNTLGELSDALADDANYASTVTTALATKAPLVSPTFTGDTTFNSTSSIKLPSGTTAQRPSSPTVGMTRFNTTLNIIEAYHVNDGWIGLSNTFQAVGGTITYASPYTYHTFTSSGTFQVTSGVKSVDYLIVAGGGGGGQNNGGGGGAGGVISSATSLSLGSYTVTIGAGGSGATGSGWSGSNGSNTSFNPGTAIGGGGGMGGNFGVGGAGGAVAGSGGSGGGQSRGVGSPGSGTAGQGSSGRNNRTGAEGGGGGGFSSGGGTGPNGGNGYTWVNGSTYCGGGGGAGEGAGNVAGLGGTGGGGRGAATAGATLANGWSNGGAGENGAANTGGGGGSADNPGTALGGNGGSGIVIVRYLS